MTHPNQYGTEGIWNWKQDTRCDNFALIPNRALDRNLPPSYEIKEGILRAVAAIANLHDSPFIRALFFRPTPYGFRQVVQHVSNHFACEIN